MADVLLARSDGIEGFERHVVVKRIRPELARDARFTRMFLDEARVAATLHHQHVVQVHDIGEAAGEYFIAMEYVHGEDVRRILSSASKQRSHVPLGYAVAIVAAAAAGLHYAHERIGSDMQPLHIVHRDVSPSNILVGYDGSIKVVDFGIATASMQRETRSGSLKGKLSDMSPEQCKGETVDRRTDVYALGVVLYELATTTRMIKGENDYRVMEQIVNGRIPSPHSRRPDLPRELSAIIMRALATDRDKRYATADELRVALDRFAASAGLVASTSVIAAYMRGQFGQRPEPWLELGPEGELEGLPVPLDGSLASNGWSELGPSDLARRSSSAIPRFSEPISALSDQATPPTPVPALPPRMRPAPTQPTHPTDSRMGWESRPVVPPRRFPIQKIAIGGGVALVGLVALLVIGLGGSAPAPAVQPRPLVAIVAPPPPQTPPPDAAIAAPVMPAITLQDPDPAPSRKPARPAAAPPPSRPASRPPTETAAARPARIAMSTPQVETPAHTTSPAPEPEHRAPEPAPAPPPPPVAAPPPTPEVVAPQVVTPSALDANRISGSKNIPPDSSTMDAIARSGKAQVQASYKVCVGVDGTLTAITLLKSTGFPDYDAKIQNAVRGEWRYRPFLINGRATPVCTALKFIYAQK